MNNNTRVLVISHNVFDKHSAMGKTLSSFFQNHDSNSLAQLYFHSEVPTSKICKQYYRITDTDAFKSIFKKTDNIGNAYFDVDIDETLNSSRTDRGFQQKVYSFGRRRTPSIYLARNFVWNHSKWFSNNLISWINNFKPEVIFFASGDYSFSYEIAYKISTFFNLPIVMYCCDDFYTRKTSFGLLSHLVKKRLICSLNKCLKRSTDMICICDKMAQSYSQLFSTNIRVVYTGYSINSVDQNCKRSREIVYLGNLGYDRSDSLVDIGKALKKVSNILSKDYCLDVYSSENRKRILKKMTPRNGIRFHPPVSSNKVAEVMKDSLIVIHTESFKKKNINKVHLSISTKIADILHSGTCCFAYGPECIASMNYLHGNNAAICIFNKNDLVKSLCDIIGNEKAREAVISNAKELANTNHNPYKISSAIEEIIDSSRIVWKNENNQH